MQEKSTSLHTICRLLLRELRSERNVQQAHIGQLLGRSTSSWSKVESGETPLSLEHLLTVCEACRVWPSDLFATAQNYMHLFTQQGWYVATYGAALPKEEDLLSIEADKYYASNNSKVPKLPMLIYPVLQTPWPYPGCNPAPLSVFQWALDSNSKSMTLVPDFQKSRV
jgi:transcriptional regulator with XRE-family HTH domain